MILNRFDLTFKSFGDSALLIEWPNTIDENILQEILTLQSIIEEELGDLILETINAYNSLTLIKKTNSISSSSLEEKIKTLYFTTTSNFKSIKKVWKVPVCYDTDFGIDLQEMALSKTITIDKIIDMHCKPEYVIYFIGFLPGFLYLGGLPPALHTSRKSQPRLKITKGAVAIGGEQTGIYPLESPGGWNIIGNSPILFFNPALKKPCFAQSGDHLKFCRVSRNEYDGIKQKVLAGDYNLEFSSSE